ncbi:hypothetical protein Ahy_B09g099851 [Arachis hypogaea]|uniref:Uncharacterized protein n=1 Tax=Arachis hypogaea TaxID=3818 RepID=A0A444XUX4_ARAHY|nr:hypothetical protein Ahy_B09g099851 [Arachis hypogaea]
MHSEGEAGEGRKGAFRPWHPKVRQPCCKYFLWLDEHIAGIGVGVTRYLGHEQILHGEEHHWNKDMEKRIMLLEKRIETLEEDGSADLASNLLSYHRQQLHCTPIALPRSAVFGGRNRGGTLIVFVLWVLLM